VRRGTKRSVLDFEAVDDRICILKTKTKSHNLSFINEHAPIGERTK
jgi:hypothetical protein